MRKRLCFVFWLALAAACGEEEPATTPPEADPVRAAPVTSFGEFAYLVLNEDAPYDRGLQHGLAMKAQIDNGVRAWRKWIKKVSGLEADQVVQGILRDTAYLATAKKQAPDLVAELQGIADGAKVDFNTLFVYGAFDETVQYLIRTVDSVTAATVDGHCTTLGVYGRKDRPNLIGQNNDLPAYHDGLHTVLETKVRGSDTQTLVFTWAGMLANNGLNSHGLGVVINFLPENGHRDGLPVGMILRRILERKSVNEAIAFLETARYAAAMNYMIGDPEKVVSVETTDRGVRVLKETGGESFVAHANHVLTDEPLPDAKNHGSTRERLDLVVRSLKGRSAEADRDLFQRILATTPVSVENDDAFGRTMQSVVMRLSGTEPTMFLTSGPPSLERFAKYVEFPFR